MTDCSGCPSRRFCCGLYTLRVFKSCLVLPETWRRDHLRNHWHRKKVGCWWQGSGGSRGKPKWSRNSLWRRLQTANSSCLVSTIQQSQKISQNAMRQSISSCPLPGIISELAVFKATIVTKEFSKCHSWWWRRRLCPFPRIVSYWLLRSHDSYQRLLKMLPNATRWWWHHGGGAMVVAPWQTMLFPGIASIIAIDLI